VPEASQSKIAHIQRWTDHVVRRAAIEIGRLGGEDAVSGYLTNTVCNVLGVAIVEQGPERACELMAAGLITAENFEEHPGC
jgi:hypothetical protein